MTAAAFLLDTHVWFWYVLGSDRLPQGLRRAIEGTGDVWLSPISVWELMLLEKRGRVRLEPDARGWVEESQRQFSVVDATLNREVSLVAGELSLPHRDPADHLIAATALVYELTLLTMDRRLTAARWLSTRSR